jgi:hypothetical protein
MQHMHGCAAAVRMGLPGVGLWHGPCCMGHDQADQPAAGICDMHVLAPSPINLPAVPAAACSWSIIAYDACVAVMSSVLDTS